MIGDTVREKRAAASRYRSLARYMIDDGARAALIATAQEFEKTILPKTALSPSIGNGRAAEKLHFLYRRYDEEMAAAARTVSQPARLAHLELALRYALRARDLNSLAGRAL